MRINTLRRSIVYETYWRFVAERQAILLKRVAGLPPPWTMDPILSQYRFTNVYRATDRVSQYLIRYVIYEGDQSPAQVVFRTILFKLFNKIETWEALTEALGPILWSPRVFQRIERVLDRLLAAEQRIYSPAYIMPALQGVMGRKHKGHLRLLSRLMREDLAKKLQKAPDMSSAYQILRGFPMLGPFLGYQFLIDLNYSGFLRFSEMDFVVPGPGAARGIWKCFPTSRDSDSADIIRQVAEVQDEELRSRGVTCRTLFGRQLQLVDCQNVFCEVDKYSRLAHPAIMSKDGTKRIKQRYRPLTAPVQLWFPPKWGLNERIAEEKHVPV